MESWEEVRATLTESLFIGTEKIEFSLPKNTLVADLAMAQNDGAE
jgi:hypothetical protein